MSPIVFTKKVRITAGTSVNHVLMNGTEPQKAAIKMFDWDQNGRINLKEACQYNKYVINNFLKDENALQVINKNGGEGYFFNYNTRADLDNFAIRNGSLYLRKEQEFIKGRVVNYDASQNRITSVVDRDEVIKYLDTEG